MIRHAFAALMLMATPAIADVLQPSEEVARVLFEQQKAFSAAVTAADADSMRSFFTDGLKEKTDSDKWAGFITDLNTRVGERGAVYIHGLKWYNRDMLVAAIDFSQPLASGDGTICGYVVWHIETLEDMAVARVEQNLVNRDILGTMSKEEAAQMMTEFRCPVPMIEGLLGISIQK